MQLILVQIAQQISSRWSDRPSKIVIEVFVKIFLFESNRFGPSTFFRGNETSDQIYVGSEITPDVRCDITPSPSIHACLQ
jgi:hypothetical protein